MLCSKKDVFEKHLESLRSWFGKRDYPKKLVDNQITRVFESKPEQLFESCTKIEIGVPLVATYHPWFHSLSNTIIKLFIYLYAEEQVKKVFTPAPFLSFRSGYSLRSHLVRAKVYPLIPLIREKGSSCCGKSKRETCFNIQETDNFQSFVAEEVYKINHHFDCDDKCVIYLVSCKVFGLQYVGSTVDRFRLRWNNYRYSQRIASEGATLKQNYFHQHFLSEKHHGLLHDCEIRLIDKTDPSDPTRRELFWMRKLKTLAPLSHNVLESV